MSQKKHKKRRPQSKHPTTNAPTTESEFSADGKRKRMNRTARTILLATLVLLAIVQLLIQANLISDALANAFSFLGLILLFIAVWIQFRGPGGGHSSSNSPRLR